MKMTSKKTWEEFRETGLLWFINTTLHMFGWAIVFDYDDNKKLQGVYPARCKFRGFDNKSNDEGYTKVTKYMKNNADELLKECEE